MPDPYGFAAAVVLAEHAALCRPTNSYFAQYAHAIAPYEIYEIAWDM